MEFNSAVSASENRLAEQAMPFEFTATGSEYFGIWIVNLLLSIATLGIYSAWAKVRRLQYFYRHTSVAGSSFEYHGQPKAILKGRIIGLVLLVLYNVSFKISPLFGAVTFVALAAAMPWLLLRSLRFKLHYSSYRGLRFRFGGSLGGAYKVFLVLPIVSLLTLFLAAPLWHQRLKRYQHGNSHFGGTAFSFDARTASFYKIYFVTAAIAVFGLAALVAAFVGLMAAGGIAVDLRHADPNDPRVKTFFMMVPLLFLGAILILSLFISPYASSRLQNLIWNHTTLGPHRFESHISSRRLFFIMFTNFLGIVLTLGLYKPFAVVRLLKYRVESLSMLSAGDLDQFVAAEGQGVSAIGEETGEMFDIDISL